MNPLSQLNGVDYATAVSGAYFVTRALAHGTSATSMLRRSTVDLKITTLLSELFRRIEETEGCEIPGLSADIRGRYIVKIDQVLSERTRLEVSYDEKEAERLLAQLRTIHIGGEDNRR